MCTCDWFSSCYTRIDSASFVQHPRLYLRQIWRFQIWQGDGPSCCQFFHRTTAPGVPPIDWNNWRLQLFFCMWGDNKKTTRPPFEKHSYSPCFEWKGKRLRKKSSRPDKRASALSVDSQTMRRRRRITSRYLKSCMYTHERAEWSGRQWQTNGGEKKKKKNLEKKKKKSLGLCRIRHGETMRGPSRRRAGRSIEA